ncbi:Tyrosinase [Tolypocladium capitatum]|uniref:Tyrosinase n=1 Tax=Tolypocladium capitatum TaxID=45235 RepID=A0A2K3QIX3_9HYPO|nr:Tyrosinase [Tolypocladium capitatum]
MLFKLAVWWVTLGVVPLALAQGHVPVTGVKVDPKAGGVPLRQNINELEARGGPAWDLFIRSLQAMYAMDPTDQLSFFQIAGIHGMPFIEWNGAGAKKTDGWEGYCPHGELIFMTWHRTYMALFEQELVKHAKTIAAEYPESHRAEYTKEAENLRLPFWDWGADQAVPPSTVPRKIKVNVTDGHVLKVAEVDNPLATYRFPQEANSGRFGPFDSEKREEIYRCPSPQSYPKSANENFRSRPYKQWLYDAFSRSSNFSEFSSASTEGGGIEQIHNTVHWDAACGGQFLAIEFSAFDPLFLMHHCNVDRLWAYWSAMHPESAVFSETYNGSARYSTPGGTRISPDSPLEPFFREDGSFHTSKSVASIQGFGYSYLGLEHWTKSAEQMKQDATKLINRLYASDASSAARLQTLQQPQTRFFANIQLDMAQVERPCTVNLYVGGKLAGNVVVMKQPGTGIMHGQFAIDATAQQAGAHGLSPNGTVDSVMSSLAVEIRNGTAIPLSSVPSLKVELEDVAYTPSSSEDQLPKYGTPRRRVASVADRSKAT